MPHSDSKDTFHYTKHGFWSKYGNHRNAIHLTVTLEVSIPVTTGGLFVSSHKKSICLVMSV